jgi:hypothetical protein
LNIRFSVRTVITQFNISRLPNMAKDLSKWGVKTWILRRVVEHEGTRDSRSTAEDKTIERQIVSGIVDQLSEIPNQMTVKYRTKDTKGANIIVGRSNLLALSKVLKSSNRMAIWEALAQPLFSLDNHLVKYLRTKEQSNFKTAVLTENT